MSISPISPEIKDTIERDLRAIEEKHNVRILYACESGSRAWGFESPDSDYDVRFIYVNRPDWYLTISERTGRNDPQRDVIEVPIENDLDYHGFDLRKALRLTYAYNATISEWLKSPIVYRDSVFSNDLRMLLDHSYRVDSTWHHHRSLASSFYHQHLDRAVVRHKRYFYALRSVLTMQWVLKHHGMRPPIEFERLLDDVIPSSDTTVRPVIAELLQRKRAGGEMEEGPQIKALDEYIVSQIQNKVQFTNVPDSDPVHLERLNTFFRRVIKE